MIQLEDNDYNTPEFYDNVLVDHILESSLFSTDEETVRLQTLLMRFSEGKLLDMGCGLSILPYIATVPQDVRNNGGFRVSFFSNRGTGYIPTNSEIHAIDFSPMLIKTLQTLQETPHIKPVHYLQGRVDNLPYKDNYFDYVVLGEVMEHCQNPQQVINEALRVLKPGGILAVSTPLNETTETHKDKQHIWSFSMEDIKHLLNPVEILTQGNNAISFTKKES